MGGDADTMAAIAYSLAAEYYPNPKYIKEIVSSRIDLTFKENMNQLQDYLSNR